MIERLKEVERVVKNFYNTPDECRYYYCKTFKIIFHVTKIAFITMRRNDIAFYMECYVVGKKDCKDSLILNNDIKLVTLDEAMKEQSEYENSLEERYRKLKSELRYLEQEMQRNVTDENTNCKA